MVYEQIYVSQHGVLKIHTKIVVTEILIELSKELLIELTKLNIG